MFDKPSVMKIFHDPSSGLINNGFFNGTFSICMETTLSGDNKENLLSLITVLSMKLASLWDVKQQYIGVLNKLKNELENDPKAGHRQAHSYSAQATELLGWFDIYLVQLKSTLDHLVKIPSPVFGYNRWNLASFGEKGEKVKKAFKNIPKEYKGLTHNYYDMIFGQHPWIEEAIDTRDKLNHGVKGGFSPKLFTVSFDEALSRHVEPMWSKDQTIEVAMEIMFKSMVNLSSIFCGLILSLKLPEERTVYCDVKGDLRNKPICYVVNKSDLKARLESQGMMNHGFS